MALDRTRNKIDHIRQNAELLRLHCIKAFCFNSTRAVSSDPAQETEGGSSTLAPGCQCLSMAAVRTVSCSIPGPPFPPESFDRVLLDAPCSGLGQRPIMANTWSLKEICSYQPLQRKLFTAVCWITYVFSLAELASHCW